MAIEITAVNIEQVSAAISHIPGAVQKATKSAISKTLPEVKKLAVEKVKARYTSPIAEFTSNLQTINFGTRGELHAKGTPISLRRFKHSPQSRINQRGVYIKSAVLKGRAKILKSAFKISDGGTILKREGKSRTPIEKLFGPAPAEMLNVPQVREPVLRQAEIQFHTNFISEVNKFL